ncbi:polyphosphate kinase 2 family protein [Streptomyces laculatispora]|uniref:polyphosphate kinase 2 family protein n=1 Tax=Streptomyces laculatispora TaxID=887464 RepID=UPI001A94A15E|nr:polyphosphate kinase 2 family protein [Streptomyces laculatispora]MBO0914222.1 polyphosphate kinase 2 family protein [Streptomyces laculatispora]
MTRSAEQRTGRSQGTKKAKKGKKQGKPAVAVGGEQALVTPEGPARDAWREDYPYTEKLGRKAYDKSKRSLQIELLKLQHWVKEHDERLVVLFEGRDAAGKGGTIKRFTENLNPRGARVVALDKPTERERTQWYFQRYVAHLPAPGEIVLCSPREYLEFMHQTPGFERMLARDGIHLVKFWFSVLRNEQRNRFMNRQTDPVRQWKLSPVDLASLDKWDAYTEAKELMLFHTDTADAPWTVAKSNDKKRAQLEAIRHVLHHFDYPDKDRSVAREPDPLIVGPASRLFEKGEMASRLLTTGRSQDSP